MQSAQAPVAAEAGRLRLYLALAAIGGAWGLSVPLTRVAVSTGHQPLGLLLWQQIVMVVFLGGIVLASGGRLPLARRHLGLFAAIALLGSVVPGYFSYLTAVDLPAGVRAIVIAIVPMFALPIALASGLERPDALRALGVLCGALAIALIALPAAGLPPAVSLTLILLALIAPLSYGLEANYLAWRGADGLHPFALLAGASAVGALVALPMAWQAGQFVDLRPAWGRAEWALAASAVLNALAYSGYVWLVGRAGSVFASQIAYVVTAFGVLWSMALLGERYSGWVWAALALMLVGLALVQPRRRPLTVAGSEP
jgi:drug/metabolite transporter (DMT)-like permease